jgi:N-methylhydantoinase B
MIDTSAAPRGDAEPLDPTTFAVVFNALNAIVEEMSLTFEYSAWSSIISECRDFSCAIYDASPEPNALCVFEGLPVHINAQPLTIAAIAEFFGPDEIREGDVIIVNSSYYGNTHVGDFVIARPLFHEGKHLFWAAATGHHMDVGSGFNTSIPVQAADVYEEGLQISPLKIYDRGELRRDVLELLLGNLRYRDFIYGDLMSQIGAVATGARRMDEAIAKWGAQRLNDFNAQIIQYASRRTDAAIGEWPDGTYSAECWIDSDGKGARDIAIRCAVTIEGSQVKIDFTGTDPQVRAGTNAGWGTCQNAAATPVLCCLDPDIPHNLGCLQHIEVIALSGTIVNAEWPAATACATTVPGDAISDVVWKCLAQAIPAKAVAGCSHVTPNCVSSGIDRRVEGKEEPFGMILFNGSGGGGASAAGDGWPMMVSTGAIGGLKFAPIEIIELHYPLLVREQEIRTDSMGAGRNRGGAGVSFRVSTVGTRVDNYGYGDGMRNPPFGVLGGKPGDGGALYRINVDGSKAVFGPLSYFRTEVGELWCAEGTGGGGYGDPCDREPERVRIDVRDGFVSFEAAEREYGVAVDRETLEVDEPRTAALRARIRKARGAEPGPLDPTTPNAGAYYLTRVGPQDTFEMDAVPAEDASLTL